MYSVKRIAAALVGGAFVSLAHGASAAPPSGQWQGQVNAGPTQRMPVTLAFAAANNGVMRFGAPAQCSLNLVFVGENVEGSGYRMESVFGGAFCDSLHGGEARLLPDGSAKLRSTLRSQYNSQRFELIRAAQ